MRRLLKTGQLVRAGLRLCIVATVGLVMTVGPGNADGLIDRVRAQFAQIKDYQCDLMLNASLPQISVSKMRMTFYYKRPGKVHITAREGFAMLPKEGLYLGDPLEGTLRTHTLRRLGGVQFNGRACVKYAVRPKEDVESPFGNMRLFVDQQLAVPVGFTASTSEGGSLKTVFDYKKINGKYWLPVRTILAVKNLAWAGASRGSEDSKATGQAELLYSNYKINIGLKDSLFVHPATPASKTRRP